MPRAMICHFAEIFCVNSGGRGIRRERRKARHSQGRNSGCCPSCRHPHPPLCGVGTTESEHGKHQNHFEQRTWKMICWLKLRGSWMLTVETLLRMQAIRLCELMDVSNVAGAKNNVPLLVANRNHAPVVPPRSTTCSAAVDVDVV